jgi:uncharacterized protein YdhG (YjbR/CyaY superfamily)
MQINSTNVKIKDMNTSTDVTKYISSYPIKVEQILTKLRHIVAEHAIEGVESMSYGMPGYKLNGKPLIYFAAYKKHIGVYPTPSGIEAFKKDLEPYKSAKGSVQFPLDSPFPYDLFTKILKYKILESKGAI